MANTRITMRKLKELLRLHFEAGMSDRAVARSLNLARSTVQDYLARFKAAKLTWPLDEGLDEPALEQKLFPKAGIGRKVDEHPDWGHIHQELKRKSVTLVLLWTEYKQDHPKGLEYSQFCELYRRFAATLNVTMRQRHKAGEKLFVDYAGQTMPVTDPTSGEVRLAQIFLAVMGASCYTFAEATWSQKLPDWIGSHVRAFSFLGGVPELVIPDNLKSGVTRPCLYDPDLNPTYREMASRYGTAVMPARVRKPKDKAKVENGVRLVERWILAALRNHTFFSLEELNDAIRELLTRLNQKPFKKKLPGCRASEFLRLDKPAMKPLPAAPYAFEEWRKARVASDYHLEVACHHYSVPYGLVGQEVEVRVTERTVEVLHHGGRVASHARSHEIGGKTTVREHMPLPHQHQLEWTPEKLMAWAEQTGYETYCLFHAILADRPHPKVAHKVCLGVVRLERHYDAKRIEAACRRANLIGTTRLESLRSILENGLDRIPVAPKTEYKPIQHENIRGDAYYARKEVWALPL